MHGADTGTDQHTADAQLRQAQVTPRQKTEGDPGGGQARQHRKQGNAQVVTYCRAQLEGEHAKKMHGPDAAAEGERAGDDGDLARTVSST